MTVNLTINNDGTPNDGWSPAGTKFTQIPLPDDDWGSWFCLYNFERQRMLIASGSIPSGATINSVTINSRICRESALQAYRTRLFLGVDSSDSPDEYGDAWTWKNTAHIMTRPGGGAWQPIDFDSLEVEIETREAWSGQVYVTTVDIVVDYTPGVSGGKSDNGLYEDDTVG